MRVCNKLIIQGSHMVSGTRCPAWSDQVKKCIENRAAARNWSWVVVTVRLKHASNQNDGHAADHYKARRVIN